MNNLYFILWKPISTIYTYIFIFWNIFYKQFLGLTPLDVAEKADHEECMIVLRAAADKIEAQRIETLTILQDACSQVSCVFLVVFLHDVEKFELNIFLLHSCNKIRSTLWNFDMQQRWFAEFFSLASRFWKKGWKSTFYVTILVYKTVSYVLCVDIEKAHFFPHFNELQWFLYRFLW